MMEIAKGLFISSIIEYPYYLNPLQSGVTYLYPLKTFDCRIMHNFNPPLIMIVAANVAEKKCQLL